MAASLLSLVATFNVPVFAGEDKDDDDGNGRNVLQLKNDDGQQSFGLNECSNTQEDFENSNNNVQNLNCEILINQLQDVRDTTNIVGNEGPIPDDAGNGEESVVECEDCFTVFDDQELEIILDLIFSHDSIEQVCDFLLTNDVGFNRERFVSNAVEHGLEEAEVEALLDCLEELGLAHVV